MRYKLAFVLFALSPYILASDLSGTYDVGTLTPLERPEQFGENLFLTEEQAEQMANRIAGMMSADLQPRDPNKGSLESSTYVSQGYNLFWVNVGSSANQVDGRFRTSIITHPKNGRKPPMTADGAARMQSFLDRWQIVWRSPDPTVGLDGSRAWWLEDGNPDGPYDHIEQRPLAERCIIGSRSTAGPPMLPNVYNNFKRIVQTDDAVMILTEMNHDARVIRVNGKHRPDGVRTWLGDSIGRWEGETLVVETKNFIDTPPLSGADENLVVEERFTKLEDGSLLYQFKVDDPTVWVEPWRGEYVWAPADGKVYEYACHEGNYALVNVMKGARELESRHE